MQKIGIFAGTFDPIHAGHIAFCQAAIEAANLDKVYILVEASPRRKQGVHALEHRQAMVAIAIDDLPNIGMIMLDQERFTVEFTLPTLLARFHGAELHILMGSDVAMHLAQWPHVQRLADQVTFMVGARDTVNPRELADTFSKISELKGLVFRYRSCVSPMPTVSSSEIRRAYRHGDEPVGLHPAVAAYIDAHGLYVSMTASLS
jgi:nicotinate-nucleotide adenylyltransferase